MYKYLNINNMLIYLYLLLLTLNVPLRIGKCTPRGTCTPGWEPCSKSTNCKNGMWTETTNPCRLGTQNC